MKHRIAGPRCACPHCEGWKLVPDRILGIRVPCEFCLGDGTVLEVEARIYLDVRERARAWLLETRDVAAPLLAMPRRRRGIA